MAWFTLQELADEKNVSIGVVEAWLDSGLPAEQIGGVTVVNADVAEAWVAAVDETEWLDPAKTAEADEPDAEEVDVDDLDEDVLADLDPEDDEEE